MSNGLVSHRQVQQYFAPVGWAEECMLTDVNTGELRRGGTVLAGGIIRLTLLAGRAHLCEVLTKDFITAAEEDDNDKEKGQEEAEACD